MALINAERSGMKGLAEALTAGDPSLGACGFAAQRPRC